MLVLVYCDLSTCYFLLENVAPALFQACFTWSERLWLTACPLLLLQQQIANSKKWLPILQTCNVENGNPTEGEQRKKVAFGQLFLFWYLSKWGSLQHSKGFHAPSYFCHVLNIAYCSVKAKTMFFDNNTMGTTKNYYKSPVENPHVLDLLL